MRALLQGTNIKLRRRFKKYVQIRATWGYVCSTSRAVCKISSIFFFCWCKICGTNDVSPYTSPCDSCNVRSSSASIARRTRFSHFATTRLRTRCGTLGAIANTNNQIPCLTSVSQLALGHQSQNNSIATSNSRSSPTIQKNARTQHFLNPVYTLPFTNKIHRHSRQHHEVRNSPKSMKAAPKLHLTPQQRLPCGRSKHTPSLRRRAQETERKGTVRATMYKNEWD